MLDATPDACVYLGMKIGVDPMAFIAALNEARTDVKKPLDAERYVNKWPAGRHDHFLIHAGTIHCSGRNGMVLEISATPYIFTFKL
jgi:mannose-6-phosphate isomerase class I